MDPVLNAPKIHVAEPHSVLILASSPGHSQILSRRHGEKLGEGLGSLLHHRLEMVDSVNTESTISGLRRSNDPRLIPNPPFPVCDVRSNDPRPSPNFSNTESTISGL